MFDWVLSTSLEPLVLQNTSLTFESVLDTSLTCLNKFFTTYTNINKHKEAFSPAQNVIEIFKENCAEIFYTF